MNINHMCLTHVITFALTVLGALNWGLYAFDFNLVHSILGSFPIAEKAVYILVALSAAYTAFLHFSGQCRVCAK